MPTDLLVFASAILGATAVTFSLLREHDRRRRRLEASVRRAQFEQAVAVGIERRQRDGDRLEVRRPRAAGD